MHNSTNYFHGTLIENYFFQHSMSSETVLKLILNFPMLHFSSCQNEKAMGLSNLSLFLNPSPPYSKRNRLGT